MPTKSLHGESPVGNPLISDRSMSVADKICQQSGAWERTLPELDNFAQVADVSRYRSIPDDWQIGISDVVDSSSAIANGRYNAINLAGAGTICAVNNALSGSLKLFAFAGDGARFAVSAAQSHTAKQALARVAAWARRELGLDLRVGMASMAEIRRTGVDVSAAYWRASKGVKYAMFAGGGLEWLDRQLKIGNFTIERESTNEDPDLSGLSCQWSPIRSTRGAIVSLIVKPSNKAQPGSFVDVASQIVTILEKANCLNPVPPEGPQVRWPRSMIRLQSKVARRGRGAAWRLLRVLATTAVAWLVFKLNVRIGRFEPGRYRREITLNTDYRKFDDGLLMTVDCTPAALQSVRSVLERAAILGHVRFGLHIQDAALITCMVPSVTSSDHMHFIDGAGGGYASAAKQISE